MEECFMYTKDQLLAVEEAIMDLQSGKRVTSVQYGNTRVKYAEVDLSRVIAKRCFCVF